ncbi:MAG: 2-oxo-tetronate isomerase [Alsobacter sp.]|nr:TIM barrel protein [Burkholderiales bacterium]
MPRFAANLSMMFNEWDFLDRFGAAADAGFDAVEFLFPYDHDPDAIGARLQKHGLTQALFNLPPGDFSAGERGIAAIAGREEEFRASVARAEPYVAATGVKRVHVMAGLVPRDPASVAVYRGNIVHAAERLARLGVQVMLEPINGRDIPGYFLNDFGFAATFIRELGLDTVRLQFDVYHRQILHGDVTRGLEALLPLTGHVQVASVPSRNEPQGEELDYGFVFETLDRLGYAGFVGCEYRPRGATLDGLGWFSRWRPR